MQDLMHCPAPIRAIFEAPLAPNTRRALERDLGFFQAWHQFRFAQAPSWPLSLKTLLLYLEDLSAEMSPELETALMRCGKKFKLGAFKPATVERRLHSLASLHRVLTPNPFQDARWKSALAALRLQAPALEKTTSLKRTLTAEELEQIIETCQGEGLIALRDKALLRVAFISGGKRSDLAMMQCEALTREAEAYLWKLPCRQRANRHRQERTTTAFKEETILLNGLAFEALKEWLEAAQIQTGPVFRAITKGGKPRQKLSDRAIGNIVKQRATQAGWSTEALAGLSPRSLQKRAKP